MHTEERPEKERWGLWLLLLGMTVLAARWTGEDRKSTGAVQDLESSELDLLKYPQTERTPPKIVFPAAPDQDRASDDSRIEIKL